MELYFLIEIASDNNDLFLKKYILKNVHFAAIKVATSSNLDPATNFSLEATASNDRIINDLKWQELCLAEEVNWKCSLRMMLLSNLLNSQETVCAGALSQ